MPSFIGVVIFAILVAWWEMPMLLEKKRKKEIAAFLTLLLLGTALYGALAMNVKLPNPFLLIKLVYGSLV
ncbi:hypothetical protein [Paenibacillus sp. PL91]|uniref:hypothetical protein n=1 Tax=Paenibacillus sp. PL91 TaxID=2729538 RepID=UPI00145E2A9A|nr:hypothetical protein [Paenibacillus sp. PL91]MBC9203453.1 hypothetical protein [Paenibacillus sp. PL91]